MDDRLRSLERRTREDPSDLDAVRELAEQRRRLGELLPVLDEAGYMKILVPQDYKLEFEVGAPNLVALALWRRGEDVDVGVLFWRGERAHGEVMLVPIGGMVSHGLATFRNMGSGVLWVKVHDPGPPSRPPPRAFTLAEFFGA
jgi:hypothetical protein